MSPWIFSFYDKCETVWCILRLPRVGYRNISPGFLKLRRSGCFLSPDALQTLLESFSFFHTMKLDQSFGDILGKQRDFHTVVLGW
jgi:hypothetical protein